MSSPAPKFTLPKAARLLLAPFLKKPLENALASSDLGLARKLLALGADPDAAVFGAHWIPLCWCSVLGNQGPAAAKLLLDFGANPDALAGSGDRPIHTASRDAKSELLTVLLDAGADPSLPDAEGRLASQVVGASRLIVMDGPARRGHDPSKERQEREDKLQGIRAQLEAATLRRAASAPQTRAPSSARL